MKRQYKIYCIMLLSVQLNVLINDFIVLVPWGFLKLWHIRKKQKEEKIIL